MAAKKDSFVTERAFASCAADSNCRWPGRLWVRTLPHDKRICVKHYYEWIDRDHSLGDDDTVPPKSSAVARPVAGPD